MTRIRISYKNHTRQEDCKREKLHEINAKFLSLCIKHIKQHHIFTFTLSL